MPGIVIRPSMKIQIHMREVMNVQAHFVEGSYDKEKRTFDVIIITEGLGNKRDKHFYLRETIKQAVQDGVFEGEQCYADHPSKFDDANRPERSVRDLVGYFMESTYREVPDKKQPGQMLGAYAAKLKIIENAEWVVGLINGTIEHNKRFPNKSLSGISINADGDTSPRTRGNLGEVNDVTKITSAFSADIVTKPARQGGFLKLVEGASGANPFNYSKGHGMVTQDQLLEAAKKLEEAQKTGEVDPALLLSIAALLKEAKGDTTAPSDDDGDEPMTPEEKAAKKKKDAEDAKDGGMDDMNEAEKAKAEKAKKEAADKGKGNLLESESDAEIKAKYPSLYAAALREANKNTDDSDDSENKRLRAKNAELEAGRDLRESSDAAKKLLRESKLPEGALQRTLSMMIGHTEPEMKNILANEERFVESLGYKHDKRVEGNNGRSDNVNIRESDATVRTNALLDGVTE